MILHNLFPIPVAKFDLGREFTPEESTFMSVQPTYKNAGNVSSLDKYVLNNDTLKNLRSFVDAGINRYFKDIYAPEYEVKLRVTQSWLNYTKPGEFHHRHTHANSFISGVLYFKVNRESDKIHFYKSQYEPITMFTKTWNLYNSPSWWVEAVKGQMLLFPSSLMHSVEPVQGDEERISLAFNTFPIGYVGDELGLTALHLRDQ